MEMFSSNLYFIKNNKNLRSFATIDFTSCDSILSLMPTIPVKM